MSDDINDLLVLFLKCFLFTVLKIRGLYPEESFKRQQVLGHLAWWSTCSEVEEYVSGLCESLRPGICRNRLRRVLLPICGAGGALRERYAVELLAEPQRLAAQGIDEVCHALRLALVKLEMSPVLLGPNTGGRGAPGHDLPPAEERRGRRGRGGARPARRPQRVRGGCLPRVASTLRGGRSCAACRLRARGRGGGMCRSSNVGVPCFGLRTSCVQ
uniref:HORMA domain-containing protein n=1 Tax=Alexandrium monilatum TaxID=311494 RepID=A0A7S4UGN8_9DINO